MMDWERVVAENARDVYRVAFRMLGSEHDAEDVTQDVFCEALRIAESGKIDDWAGMLRRIAALRSYDRLRRRRETVAIDVGAHIDSDPSAEAMANELAVRLREAIGELSQQEAAVFSLGYFNSLSRDEIASSLEIAPAAVSTALYKARQKLKTILAATVLEASDE
jgi:RNA polymerase sigma-70 factor (ECF subfamily)